MPAKPRRPAIYRVFQHRSAPGLCCAVREGLLTPYLFHAHARSFGTEVREDRSLPLGFQPRPAREATAAFGYYIVHHPCEALSPRFSWKWAGHARDPRALRNINRPRRLTVRRRGRVAPDQRRMMPSLSSSASAGSGNAHITLYTLRLGPIRESRRARENPRRA